VIKSTPRRVRVLSGSASRGNCHNELPEEQGLMTKEVVLLVAHGTRNPSDVGNREVEELADL